jgi:hypothetical protein
MGAGALVQQPADVELNLIEYQFSRFDFREIENVADHAQQGMRAVLRRFQLFALLGRQAAVQQIIPMTPLSGVRSSCDTLARNSLFAWLAERARCTAASSSSVRCRMRSSSNSRWRRTSSRDSARPRSSG